MDTAVQPMSHDSSDGAPSRTDSPGIPPQDPYDRYRSTPQFRSLDGLRAAAILAVIWHHTVPDTDLLPAGSRGYLGVDLFFVLSGFLIVTLLLREREITGGISLAKFYARRTLRIFPVYYGLLLGLAIVMLVFKAGSDISRQFFAALPFYLTYTSNWTTVQAPNLGITWSLAAEEQFYVVWPAIERFLRPRWTLIVLGLLLAVNQAINFRLLDPVLEGGFGLRYRDLNMLQVTFTPILLGVALAHVLHSRQRFGAVHKMLGGRYSVLVVFAALLALCNVPGDQQGWHRLLTQLTMMALLASCVVREDHALHRVLAFPWLVRIGMISYGMYLFHLWARHLVVEVIGPSPLNFPGEEFILTLFLTILISELSFRFYEKPFLALKRRFSRTGQAPRHEGAG